MGTRSNAENSISLNLSFLICKLSGLKYIIFRGAVSLSGCDIVSARWYL